MQKPLDITSSSSIAPAPSGKPSLSGAGKTDPAEADALGGKFAGLLNHALQGPQPEAHQAGLTLKPATAAKSDAPKPDNAEVPAAATPTPDAEKLSPKLDKTMSLDTQALAMTPKATLPVDLSASQPEALPTQAETLPTTTSAEDPQTPDKPADKTNKEAAPIGAQDLLALSLTLQPQPLNLAVLQAAAPLLAQPMATPPQPTEIPNSNTTGLTTEASAITSTTVVNNAVAVPQAASQLTLMPGLLTLPKSPQGGPAFSLPKNNSATNTSDSLASAGTPVLSDKQANPVGGVTPQHEATAQTISSPSTDTPAANAQPDALISLSNPSSVNPSSLSLSPPASSEGTMGNGDLTRQTIAPLAGLSTGAVSGIGTGLNVSKVGQAGSKPNATQPTTDAFQKSLSSIQTNLNAMQGSIETSPDSTAKGIKEPKPADSATPADSSTLSASDLMSATSLNSANQSDTTQGSGNDTTVGGVAQFSSSAHSPTDQVAEGTAYSVKNGHKELIIRLNPDNLGEVKINLTSNGNQQLSARLIASTPESHELLKSQMDTLKNSLTAQGVNVDRISVVLAGSSESGNTSNSNHEQPTQQQSQQQQSSQQGSFQQQFNQQNPSNAGLFSQMSGQSQQQQNFSQNQAQSRLGDRTDSVETGLDGLNSATSNPSASHDNGRISILA